MFIFTLAKTVHLVLIYLVYLAQLILAFNNNKNSLFAPDNQFQIFSVLTCLSYRSISYSLSVVTGCCGLTSDFHGDGYRSVCQSWTHYHLEDLPNL